MKKDFAYCDACKFKKVISLGSWTLHNECKANPIIKQHPVIGHKIIKSNCMEKNKNNDCPDFKKTWLSKLFR